MNTESNAYPLDIEVTTAQRNYVLNHMIFTDANYPRSHVIRVFSAREHAKFLQCLDELANTPALDKSKIGQNNHIPLNYTDKWQVWQFLFGWHMVSEHDSEAAANAANDEIYNGKVVAPEPMVDQPALAFEPEPGTDDNGVADYRHLWMSSVIATDINAFWQRAIDIVKENE